MPKPDRPALICQHCGAAVLPVDPGWTLRETAKMLRITPAYVSALISDRAAALGPPRYRRLSGHPRLYRILSGRDVRTLEAILQENAVKSHSQSWASRPRLTRGNEIS